MSKITRSTDFALRVQSLSNQKPIDEILAEIIGDRWIEYRNRWKKASSREIETNFPLFVLFEDQYACNLKCKMCIHGNKASREKYRYKGSLDLETYCRLIDECVQYNCPSVCMNNINEPLLERDIFDRINYAHKKGIIDIHMNTNATLLTKQKSEMLLEAGLTRLLIGFDGFTKNEYENIRDGAHYDEVMENVNTFLELKKKKKKKLPIVRISLVCLKDNVKNLEKFTQYWLGKVDYVAIQKFYPFDNEESKVLKIDREGENAKENICTSPWERITIQGDGAVLPCCSMTAREIMTGNINESTIYEIWNSPGMKSLRAKHKKQDIQDLPVCVQCLG